MNHESAPASLKSSNAKLFDAILFDMDGTLLNSNAVIDRIWRDWCIRHKLDLKTVKAAAHGRRTNDTVRLFCPAGVDPELEAAELIAREEADIAGIVPVSGAYDLLTNIPSNRWAIVTSANLTLARNRMEAAGLPLPSVVISAENVTRGKPSPEGYLLAANKLGVNPHRCLVFEDAPAGVAAALAAGASVVVITEVYQHRLPYEVPGVCNFNGIAYSVESDGIRISGLES